MELTQEEKAARLQWAVLNCSVAALVNICDELGFVEMSAPALGLACRFRGLEVVRALAEKGATFDFPSTEEIEEKYRCYVGYKYANYRTNYALYLLKIFRGGVKGACSMKGMKFTQNAKSEQGSICMRIRKSFPFSRRSCYSIRYLPETPSSMKR